jgi:F-box protein, helicase, 18
MKLTPEQLAIIHSDGNIKVNAVAGSGKTTTIIEYAKSRPPGSRMLYLAFNKSVKSEAVERFAAAGLTHVDVHTAHSLAYKHTVRSLKSKLSQGYKPHELAEALKISGGSSHIDAYIIADHVLKFVSYFCNSDVQKVLDLNYIDTIDDPKIAGFVSHHYEQIVAYTRAFLAKMDKGEMEVLHDFYLKKFQLSKPRLSYDYILFDEAHDASGAMLDVFLNQQSTLVMVGDTHQQIYGWRYAVNSLEKVDFPVYQLTQSFRFGKRIAQLAMEVLTMKNSLAPCVVPRIQGMGGEVVAKPTAMLARTNLGLLINAIDYVAGSKSSYKIHFEGDINSYTYASEGASLYDVLNLYNDKHDKIRDKLIRSMPDFDDLKDYIEKTGDKELSMMVDLVEEYENDIFDIIKELKERHVGHGEKSKAKMIFSTIHRCKGMEYDSVQLANDFLDETTLERELLEPEITPLRKAKLAEEINLLYVAITRTKGALYIPERIIPEIFVATKPIIPVDKNGEILSDKQQPASPQPVTEKTTERIKSDYMERVKKTNPSAYNPWTRELDVKLERMYCEGKTIEELAEKFQRTHGAIRSRIKKLELEEKYG